MALWNPSSRQSMDSRRPVERPQNNFINAPLNNSEPAIQVTYDGRSSNHWNDGRRPQEARSPEIQEGQSKAGKFFRKLLNPAPVGTGLSTSPRQQQSYSPAATSTQSRPLGAIHGRTAAEGNAYLGRQDVDVHGQSPYFGLSNQGLWSWIPYLKQPADDAAVKSRVKEVLVLAEQYVSNCYSNRPYYGEIPNEVFNRVNCSNTVPAEELQKRLMEANIHIPIIIHVLVTFMLDLISFDTLASYGSLLPYEFQNFSVIAKARSKFAGSGIEIQELQPALSSYRVLSSYIRADVQSDENYLHERRQTIEKAFVIFDRAFQHWANKDRDREFRRKMLHQLLEKAGDLGIFLFSQPSVFDFHWDVSPEEASSETIPVWPRLLRVFNNSGQYKEVADHMIPMKFETTFDPAIKTHNRLDFSEKGQISRKPVPQISGLFDQKAEPPTLKADSNSSLDTDSEISVQLKQEFSIGKKYLDMQQDQSSENLNSGITQIPRNVPYAGRDSKLMIQASSPTKDKTSTGHVDLPAALMPGNRDRTNIHHAVTTTRNDSTNRGEPHSTQNRPFSFQISKDEPPQSGPLSDLAANLQWSFDLPRNSDSPRALPQFGFDAGHNASGASQRATQTEAKASKASRSTGTTISPDNPPYFAQDSVIQFSGERTKPSVYPNSGTYSIQHRGESIDSYFNQNGPPLSRDPSMDNELYQLSYRTAQAQILPAHLKPTAPNQDFYRKSNKSTQSRSSSKSPSKVEEQRGEDRRRYPPSSFDRSVITDSDIPDTNKRYHNQATSTPSEHEGNRGRAYSDSTGRTRRKSSSGTRTKKDTIFY